MEQAHVSCLFELFSIEPKQTGPFQCMYALVGSTGVGDVLEIVFFSRNIQGKEQLHELNKCLLVKKLSVKIFEASCSDESS